MAGLTKIEDAPTPEVSIESHAQTLADGINKPVAGRHEAPKITNRQSGARDSTVHASQTAPGKPFGIPVSGWRERSKISNKVHILGDNPRSRFLAYALKGKFDSIRWVERPNQRNPVVHVALPAANGDLQTMRNTALPRRGAPHYDTDPIKNLIVMTSASQTVEAIDSIRHRLTDETVMCLMQDRLGVVEAVDEKLAEKEETKKPAYIVGHMSQAYRYDQDLKAVVEKSKGRVGVTAVSLSGTDTGGLKADVALVKDNPATANFISKICTTDHIKGAGYTFQRWLYMKLPTVVFLSVVEPLCVVLGCRYDELMHNKWGHVLMQQLLAEISQVVLALPEVQQFPGIQTAFTGEGIRKMVYDKIRAKGKAPGFMAMQIERGFGTDIDFLTATL